MELTNLTIFSSNVTSQHTWTTESVVRVILYSLIFILTVCGNALVIVTLLHNKRKRTVTNVFLFNLSVSDLFLGVFCMPFTITGSLLRDFIFGEVMCKMIPYIQAVTVSVSVWTLVSISLERYFAICQPLKSRQWQTVAHAKRIILLIWLASLFTMSPIALLSRLIQTKQLGKHKCREVWPNVMSERTFNLYLDVVLLGIPLIIMILVYSLIVRTLYSGINSGHASKLVLMSSVGEQMRNNTRNSSSISLLQRLPSKPRTSTRTNQLIIRGNFNRCRRGKIRVIRMLFVLVIEFFVCWTPLYIINTWSLYDPFKMYQSIGSTSISVIQLLAYTSSCCNPITYCFMYSKFRKDFMAIMGCRLRSRQIGESLYNSATHNSLYSTRGMTNDTDMTEKLQDDCF